MRSRRSGASLNIQCRPASLAVTFSIVLLTPKGLPQRMQQNGSSCFNTRTPSDVARKLILGTKVMTFSGQVDLHNPHWTHASSAKRRAGLSGSSRKAPVGQAETQDRHSVQPS